MANTNAFPFDAIQQSDGSYDREFTSNDFASYFNKILTNGVFASVGNSLRVDADNNSMFVTIKDGAVFINGRVREWTFDEQIRVTNSNDTFDRIDAVVARLDLINRQITLAIVEGSASAVPTAPAITQTDDLYELCLAEIYVGSGVTLISQANVTDKRDSSLCGYVSSLVSEDVAEVLDKFLNATNESDIEEALDGILGV